ncbi:MAG: inorganic phosphate transporter PitA [Candidatus Arsenophonus melophagi]|nr:inorganic phosphate transporter PitA [Candidatus Arsenophonus melophagi]
MLHLFAGLDIYTGLLLILALLFVLLYEAINGFHDTANAVATVIYTRAMQAQFAVIMAGIFNFFGVVLGGLSVAYAIVHLLPTNLLLNVSSSYSLALVFSMLFAAIIWNVGTWYLGLPASSSHTLIGAIIGVGLTNAVMSGASIGNALNIQKVIEIFVSLILSPIIGFMIAGFLIFFLRCYWNNTKKRRRIHLTPSEREKQDGKRKPPFWTRTALILSAVGVSFSHGANDGQKGIGLIMLVLIGVVPAGFVLNMNASSYDITRTNDALVHLQHYYEDHQSVVNLVINKSQTTLTLDILDKTFYCDHSCFIHALKEISLILGNIQNYLALQPEQRNHIRRLLICLSDTTLAMSKLAETPSYEARFLRNLSKDLLNTVEYAPLWIIIAVALALSVGTMIGWQRVTITIGEKIGKTGLTYAQGVSTQITAAVSIGVASYTGMPVSTTQVLSAAVAGTMIIDGGGVQTKTIKNILLAWFFTLPISIILSGFFYWICLILI